MVHFALNCIFNDIKSTFSVENEDVEIVYFLRNRMEIVRRLYEPILKCVLLNSSSAYCHALVFIIRSILLYILVI